MNFEKPKKSEFLENEKNCWRYHQFTHVYQKPQSYEVQFLTNKVRQISCHSGPFFPFNTPSSPPPNNPDPENPSFEKLKTAFVEMSSF